MDKVEEQMPMISDISVVHGSFVIVSAIEASVNGAYSSIHVIMRAARGKELPGMVNKDNDRCKCPWTLVRVSTHDRLYLLYRVKPRSPRRTTLPRCLMPFDARRVDKTREMARQAVPSNQHSPIG